MSEENFKFPLYFQCKEDHEPRLDVFLLTSLERQFGPGCLSRSRIQKWIQEGLVLVNEQVIRKAGYKVQSGNDLKILGLPASDKITSFELILEILFEDEHVLVINKPAGLTVHPGAGNRDRTLLNAVADYFKKTGQEVGGLQRMGLVHRLDKDTSGVMVLAKSLKAEASLSKQFASRSIQRSYRAICLRSPRAGREIDRSDSGKICTQIGRDPVNRLRMSVLAQGGKSAITHWKVLERSSYASLLELRLETGRTHQIRVHMQYLKSPIIGDPLYGDFSSLPRRLRVISDQLKRQALHAATLGFRHPETDELQFFSSEVPDDFAHTWAQFLDFKE